MTGSTDLATGSPRRKRKESSQRTQTFLQHAKLLDARDERQQLFFLEHDWTVGRALKELAHRRILSAPLILKPDLESVAEEGEGSDPTFLGWIDIAGIFNAFLQGLSQRHKPIPDKMLQLMPILEAEGREFAQKQLISIPDSKDKALISQADVSTSLLDAIRDMFLKNYTADGKGGTNRVAVFNTHGAITNVVSQLDIMRFLLHHIKELGYIAFESVASLEMLSQEPSVLLLDHSTPTLIALQQMHDQGISAAAIHAPGNSMIANLSVSDLRCIQAEHFGKLALPVAEYLALTHDTAYAGYAAEGPDVPAQPFFGSSPQPNSPSISPRKRKASSALESINSGIHDTVAQPVVCTPESTLQEVLELLVKNSVHRLYVAGPADHGKPEHTVTPADIMLALCKHTASL